MYIVCLLYVPSFCLVGFFFAVSVAFVMNFGEKISARISCGRQIKISSNRNRSTLWPHKWGAFWVNIRNEFQTLVR